MLLQHFGQQGIVVWLLRKAPGLGAQDESKVAQTLGQQLGTVTLVEQMCG